MGKLQDIIINNAIWDEWSPVHIFFGLIVGALVPNRVLGYGLIIGWEILENVFLRTFFAQFYQEQETIVNIISDIIITLGAYELGRISSPLVGKLF